LSAIPPDPFSGKPFHYRRAGTRYLLYSIGPVLKDNGGAPMPVVRYTTGLTGGLVAGKVVNRLPQW
jgi:hypothetical protein